MYAHSVTQWCSTLCDPMDFNLPSFSIYRILQIRILEWLSFSPPGDHPDPKIKPTSPALQADSLPLSYHGSPSLHTLLYSKVHKRTTTCRGCMRMTIYVRHMN